MNDLVTPFLAVFLSEHLPGPMEAWSSEALTEVKPPTYFYVCRQAGACWQRGAEC